MNKLTDFLSAHIFRPTLVVLLLLGSSACVPKNLTADLGSAEQVWQSFNASSAQAEQAAAPYRITASLRYDTPQKDGHRVMIYFWGNAGQNAPVHPIRLDVQAGIGVMAAKIREDSQLFVAYIPQEEKAYYNPEGSRAMINFGLPLPFTLEDLSLLLTGRYTRLFLRHSGPQIPPLPGNISKNTQGNLVFKMDKGFSGSLELDAHGVLLSWQEKPGGWLMELRHTEADADLEGYGPVRISFRHPDGYEAIVLLKERDYSDQDFTPEQLEMHLPPNTNFLPLKQH